jgi:hypothetical protein
MGLGRSDSRLSSRCLSFVPEPVRARAAPHEQRHRELRVFMQTLMATLEPLPGLPRVHFHRLGAIVGFAGVPSSLDSDLTRSIALRSKTLLTSSGTQSNISL